MEVVDTGQRVGPDRTASVGAAWARLRVHPATPSADRAGAVLRYTFATQTEADGSTWLPLIVLAGVAGAVMAARLVEQIDQVVSALREAATTS